MRHDNRRINTAETTVEPRHMYVIIYDQMSGRTNRYTVHRINRFGFGKATVIGRELQLKHARAVVKRSIDQRRTGPLIV